MDIESNLTLHTGTAMPILGLGTWQLTDDTAHTVAEALNMGYRLVDTSGDYGIQPGVGEGIQQSGIVRGAIYLVTKVEETDDAYQATRKDLRELGLDYADLMLIHRPPKEGVGEELWEGLIHAKEEGLTRDIGVSNYSIEQLDALIEATHEVPVVNQIEWSPFGHSRDMLQYCRDRHIVIQAYSPLTRQHRLDDELLQDLAERYHKTPAQIIIRWNLQIGSVPILKASSQEHLQENIDVFDFELNREDMEQLHHLDEKYSSLSSHPVGY